MSINRLAIGVSSRFSILHRKRLPDGQIAGWYLESQIGIAAHPSRRPRSLSSGAHSRDPLVASSSDNGEAVTQG
jgi:hypothetical protein